MFFFFLFILFIFSYKLPLVPLDKKEMEREAVKNDVVELKDVIESCRNTSVIAGYSAGCLQLCSHLFVEGGDHILLSAGCYIICFSLSLKTTQCAAKTSYLSYRYIWQKTICPIKKQVKNVITNFFKNFGTVKPKK